MRYLLFICTDPAGEPYVAEEDDIETWLADLERRGAAVDGSRLRPPEDATTVRVRDGKVLVSDGPFAETKEWIAGFDQIECANLDEAIEIASGHPMARFGRIEIRPLWPFDAAE